MRSLFYGSFTGDKKNIYIPPEICDHITSFVEAEPYWVLDDETWYSRIRIETGKWGIDQTCTPMNDVYHHKCRKDRERVNSLMLKHLGMRCSSVIFRGTLVKGENLKSYAWHAFYKLKDGVYYDRVFRVFKSVLHVNNRYWISMKEQWWFPRVDGDWAFHRGEAKYIKGQETINPAAIFFGMEDVETIEGLEDSGLDVCPVHGNMVDLAFSNFENYIEENKVLKGGKEYDKYKKMVREDKGIIR